MISLLDSLIYVVLAGALSFEAVNFILLIKLRHWSQTAGKSLISQVIKALNIRSNALVNLDGEKGESLKNALSNVVSNEAIQPLINDAIQSGKAPSIDIGSLIQGFMEGRITRADLVQYAPLLINMFKDKKPESENVSHSRW